MIVLSYDQEDRCSLILYRKRLTQLFRWRRMALSHNDCDAIQNDKSQSFTCVDVTSETSPSSYAQAPFLCEIVIGSLILRFEPSLPKARIIELIRVVREA